MCLKIQICYYYWFPNTDFQSRHIDIRLSGKFDWKVTFMLYISTVCIYNINILKIFKKLFNQKTFIQSIHFINYCQYKQLGQIVTRATGALLYCTANFFAPQSHMFKHPCWVTASILKNYCTFDSNHTFIDFVIVYDMHGMRNELSHSRRKCSSTSSTQMSSSDV